MFLPTVHNKHAPEPSAPIVLAIIARNPGIAAPQGANYCSAQRLAIAAKVPTRLHPRHLAATSRTRPIRRSFTFAGVGLAVPVLLLADRLKKRKAL